MLYLTRTATAHPGYIDIIPESEVTDDDTDRPAETGALGLVVVEESPSNPTPMLFGLDSARSVIQ